MKRGHRHKTACDLMRQLLRVLLRWFPQRRFLFSGDGGCGTHALAVITGTAPWYKPSQRLVSVRWVFVEDLTGTHRDEYFFTTETGLTPQQVIEACTGLWAIELTFEEAREHVGLETTRGYCARTILRAEPCLFGLYTFVALWFSELTRQEIQQPVVGWTGSIKQTLTFSDAITLVRRQVWGFWLLECPRHATAFQKLTRSEKHAMLDIVTYAL
jgi:hypothetical protein